MHRQIAAAVFLLVLSLEAASASPTSKPIDQEGRRAPPPLETITIEDLEKFPFFLWDVFFSSDFDVDSQRLRRWRPASATVVVSAPAEVFPEVEQRMKEFFAFASPATGIRFSVQRGEEFGIGDISFQITDSDAVQQLVGTRPLSGRLLACSGGNGVAMDDPQTDSVTYAIVRASHEHWRTCLDEELAQVLGMSGDTRRFPGKTTFDDYTGEAPQDGKLTAWDRLALWIFFDRRLEPGMSDKEALPIIQKIVDELKAQLAAQ